MEPETATTQPSDVQQSPLPGATTLPTETTPSLPAQPTPQPTPAATQTSNATFSKDGVLFQQKHQNRNDAPTGRLEIINNTLVFTDTAGNVLLNLDVFTVTKMLYNKKTEMLALYDASTIYGFYFPGWQKSLYSVGSAQFGLLGKLLGGNVRKKIEAASGIDEFIAALRQTNPNIKNTSTLMFILVWVAVIAVTAIISLVSLHNQGVIK